MPLRTLYPPDGDASDHCKVDIIAVHGLNPRNKDDEDHAWDTWRSPAGPGGHLWLRDDLPEHVPEARIFLYRYEATAVYGTDRDTFVGKANELLEEIRVERGDIKTRPIIFIGHSMGGLLIKQSLINAHNNPKYTAIKDATSGLAFFATPHKGVDSNLRSLGELIARIAKHAGFRHGDSILEVLREGGIFNDVMQEHWRHQLLQYDIISFWGASDDIVERENARLGMPGDRENLVKLHAGHGGVCRFGASQVDRDNLKLVRGNIKDIYGKAIEICESNLEANCDGEDIDRSLEARLARLKNPEAKAYDVAMKDDLDADRHLRDYYSDQRLRIERLSGKRLSIEHCYINLAIVKTEPEKPPGPSEGDPSAAIDSSPFELSSRLKIRQPARNVQVNLKQLFDSRQYSDNHLRVVRRVLIHGRAGVGKTTLCKKIVFDFQHQKLWKNLFDRVLWVPLRRLKNWTSNIFNFRNFLHHLYFVHDDQNGHILAEHLENMIGFNKRTDCTGKTLFILDGLDEVSGEWNPGDPKHDFLIKLLDQPSVIITSRPHAQIPHHAENPIDLEVETMGFYPDQVKNYLTMAFQNADKVTRAQATLDEFPLIQGLIRIPILLDAFTYIWESRLTLESGRILQTMTSFYRLIVEELLKKDIVQLKIKRRSQEMTEAMARKELPCALEEAVQEPLLLLEELAFIGMSEGIIEFDPHIRNTVLQASESLKRTSQLDQALQRTSFLRTSNLSQDGEYVSYHFLHFTFQEFFAARYFVRQWISTGRITCPRLGSTTAEGIDGRPLIISDFVARYKYELRYNIFWRFVAGLLEIKGPEVITQFFHMLQDSQRDLLGPAHQRLIMHCLSEISSQMSLRQDLETELEKWLILETKLTHRSMLSREMEFPTWILDKVLKEGGRTAAIILRNLSDRFFIPNQIFEVIMNLLQDDDPYVREAAAEALSSQTSNHQVQQALLGRLQDDDSDVRQAAAEALSSQTSNHQVQQALLDRLQDDNPYVRLATAEALSSQASNYQVQQALLGRLQDNNHYVRLAAAEALSSQTSDHQVQQALLSRLQDDFSNVRKAAAKALSSQASNHQVQQALLSQLQDDDSNVRQAAAEALSSQTSNHQMQQALLDRLQDNYSTVRRASAKAFLRQMNNARHPVDEKYFLPLYLVLLENSFDYHVSWQAQSSRFHLITPWGYHKLHVSNVSRSIRQFQQIREVHFQVDSDNTKKDHF